MRKMLSVADRRRLRHALATDPRVLASNAASNDAFMARQDNPCPETYKAEQAEYLKGYRVRWEVKAELGL